MKGAENMSKAFEMMNTQVVKVHPEDSLEDVVKILLEHKISGVPVLDDDNKVVGMISGRDLLKHTEMLDKQDNSLDFSVLFRPRSYTAKSVPYEANTNLFLITRVEEVMSTAVVSVKEHSSFHDVVILMKEHKINRIPVVDEEGRLKGLITRTDLINYLAEKND